MQVEFICIDCEKKSEPIPQAELSATQRPEGWEFFEAFEVPDRRMLRMPVEATAFIEVCPECKDKPLFQRIRKKLTDMHAQMMAYEDELNVLFGQGSAPPRRRPPRRRHFFGG